MTTSMDERSWDFGFVGLLAHRYFGGVCVCCHDVLYYYVCMGYEEDDKAPELLVLTLCMSLYEIG